MPHVDECSGYAFAAKPSGGEDSDPQPWQSPRQPLHFVPAVVTGFASTPDPKKCSAARESREKGEPARAAEGLGIDCAHCRAG